MKKLFSIILMTAILSSCKKDSGDDNCTLSTKALAGKYRTTSVKYKQTASFPEVDYYPVLFADACDRDDYITYNADGTYTITDAGSVCFPNNNSSGTWSLSGNTFTQDSPSNTSTVERFDCNSFTTKHTNVFVSGDILYVTVTRQ